MDLWKLRDAELELERLISMSEEEFRALVVASGDDVDQVLEAFDAVVWKAIAAAAKAER